MQVCEKVKYKNVSFSLTMRFEFTILQLELYELRQVAKVRM
jgi:hypothetical protein